MREYRELFLQESATQLARIEAILEERPDSLGADGSETKALFREFHSLKGMAATMRLKGMAALAHRAEDMLGGFSGSGQLDRVAKDLIQRVADRLSAMREDFARGGNGELPWEDLGGLFDSGGSGRKGTDAVEKDGGPVFGLKDALKVTVRLDPETQAPAARAYMVLMRFMESAPGLKSRPSMDEIAAGIAVAEITMEIPGMDRAEAEAIYSGLTEVAGIEFGGAQVREQDIRRGGGGPPDRMMFPDAVEVSTRMLDRLVELVGELSIMDSRFKEIASQLGSRELKEETRTLKGLVRELDDSVMEMRCLPFSTLTGRLRRFVRENCERLGKKARLTVTGGSIGVDKAVMARLSAPLNHLLRNALDHGLEKPEERRRAGKPEEGSIDISLERSKNKIRLKVADDGRGIDPEALYKAAMEKGLPVEGGPGALSVESMAGILFSPGFSTKADADELSGRGVGLDAVAAEVASLGGEIRIETAKGVGTAFEIVFPQTSAITPVLTFLSGGMVLAVGVQSVAGTREVAAGGLNWEGGEPYFSDSDGEWRKIRFLTAMTGAAPGPSGERLLLVEIAAGGKRAVYAVDAVLAEEFVFTRPLTGMWSGMKGLSGYSVTGDGRIIYLLDVAELCG